MEVEHFNPKSLRPDLVVDWTNLLPSCGKCNGSKSNHDVAAEPIINPFDQDPRDHLALKSTWFVGITDLGKMTIDVLPLNELAGERNKLINALNEVIEPLLLDLQALSPTAPVAPLEIRRLRRKAKAILRSGTPQKDYAATSAGHLVRDDDWLECVKLLKQLHIWTAEEEALLVQVQAIALPFYTPAYRTVI